MRTLVTGAGGFVGRELIRQASTSGVLGRLRLVDRALPQAPTPASEVIAIDLAAAGSLEALLEDIDCVIHLAAMPGGAAQADPDASRRINLEVTSRLLSAAAAGGRPIRFVHASSIAVFGTPMPAAIDDDTPAEPSMVYGIHKRMAERVVERAAAERRVDAVSIRLPGIVARPSQGTGFKSAFMSDVFWAVRAGERYVVPVGPHATMWLMSASRCAANLLHAATASLGDRRVMTLPALRVTMEELIAAVAAVTGGSSARIAYDPDPVLEEQFGSLPPLSTPWSDGLGFSRDTDAFELARAVFSAEASA